MLHHVTRKNSLKQDMIQIFQDNYYSIIILLKSFRRTPNFLRDGGQTSLRKKNARKNKYIFTGALLKKITN